MASPGGLRGGATATSLGPDADAAEPAADPIVALMPLTEGMPLADFRPIIIAQEEALYYNEAQRRDVLSEVVVIKDEEVKKEVVEILGPEARVQIPCHVELPYLVLQVKDVERFAKVELSVVDEANVARQLVLSNKVSAVRIGEDRVTLPLVLTKGWNYINVDLDDIVARAFGVQYKACTCVTIYSNLRVLTIFFQDRCYEDVELPAFLRVIE